MTSPSAPAGSGFPWRAWLIQELKRKGVPFSDELETFELWSLWRKATEPDRRFSEAIAAIEGWNNIG